MSASASAVCIIPARGGSKRIPRKNIRNFRGRPILAWSVAAARASGVFSTVMVSTDDSEIADVARAAGADIPFLRSSVTSGDHATTSDVLAEVLARYAEGGRRFDLGCCLYPTAPFVTAADIVNGRARLLAGHFDVVMPVAAFSYPIWRSLRRDGDGRIALNFPGNLNARSQDLPPAFHDAGQWYWFRTAAFVRNPMLMGEKTGSIVLHSAVVQDIDTEEDWALAELKHQRVFG
jgi:N-acylneuraminate cytidylyltransferase